MTHAIVEEDIHNIRRRYENATRNLNENQTIPEPNKQKIRDFLAEYGVTHELSTARKLFYLQHLTTIARILGATMILDATKTDLERVLSALIEKRTLGGGGRRLQGKKNENTTTSPKPTAKDPPEHSGQTRSGKPLAAWTIWGFKVTMKVFWRWLRGCEEDEDPPETGRRANEVTYLAECNAESIEKLLAAYFLRPTSVLFINDVSMYLQSGQVKTLMKAVALAETFVANSYEGAALEEDRNSGVSRRERVGLATLKGAMDYVLTLGTTVSLVPQGATVN